MNKNGVEVAGLASIVVGIVVRFCAARLCAVSAVLPGSLLARLRSQGYAARGSAAMDVLAGLCHQNYAARIVVPEL